MEIVRDESRATACRREWEQMRRDLRGRAIRTPRSQSRELKRTVHPEGPDKTVGVAAYSEAPVALRVLIR